VNAFTRYLHALESALQAGDATESTHRPALKSLLESLQQGIVAVNEPKRIACGAPDFAIRRTNASGHGVTLGYLETKDIGAPLDAAEMTDQLQRYRDNLPNLILTNYLEFRWYVDGARRQIARLAEWDARAKRLRRTPNGANELHALLQASSRTPPRPSQTPTRSPDRWRDTPTSSATRLSPRSSKIWRPTSCATCARPSPRRFCPI
jgi:hypothetical protein